MTPCRRPGCPSSSSTFISKKRHRLHGSGGWHRPAAAPTVRRLPTLTHTPLNASACVLRRGQRYQCASSLAREQPRRLPGQPRSLDHFSRVPVPEDDIGHAWPPSAFATRVHNRGMFLVRPGSPPERELTRQCGQILRDGTKRHTGRSAPKHWRFVYRAAAAANPSQAMSHPRRPRSHAQGRGAPELDVD